ncbi:P-aminobenzoate N-oxygenase AurF [Actinomadura rubteroloni]|uniref:p-aminobenzoate N-oxygenase AurF n=1 Tax=Actinomadura rubteroloni TaxID=1926885 RepID=A0A2P4ULF7_9ACTN|nr:diiron oxygenase [Actinomadura rubteroloni]POM25829.1 P-aminobenzoate N-oxygenase AurF [Actinomadura rubteroloni]
MTSLNAPAPRGVTPDNGPRPRRTARDRETVALRLLRSAARASFDPDAELDWDAPFDKEKPFLPLERVSLYGTPFWDGLTHARRVELSRHELASVSAAGIWLEMCLMQLFLRFLYDVDPRTAHAQFGLTEVGDETRHVVMFAKLMERLGTPVYGPPAPVRNIGRLFKALGSGPSMWAVFLVGEEIFDRMQRAAMADTLVQPLIREISRIHVVEEARHVRYARAEIERSVRGLGRTALARHRLVAAVGATATLEFMIDPEVYRCVGLEPAEGRAMALANPHHLATRHWLGAKIVPFLDELGLISGPGAALWRRAGLIQ